VGLCRSGKDGRRRAAASRQHLPRNSEHPAQITGICYTQFTDVEQEVNGLLTYDRKPKFDTKKIKALNDRLN